MWTLRCLAAVFWWDRLATCRNARLAIIVLFAAVAAGTARAAVTFELSHDRMTTQPAAVFVAGSFNNWSTSATEMACDGTTAWRATVSLPDGRHFYKFVWVDAAGQRHTINDPASPFLSDDGSNGANNFVDVLNGERVALTTGLEKFEWTAPTAKWVSVAGDFNSWLVGQFQLARQSDGKWIACLPLRRPLAYKFIIDGLWKIDADAKVEKVPNGFGAYNSFRPAAVVSSPADVMIKRTVAAGDTHELDLVTSHAASGEYGQAIALARKIAEVNAAASGTTAPLVLRALDLEAAAHKRWNRLDDAAQCWLRLAESDADTSETFRAIAELAAYYFYVHPDNKLARRVNEIAIARAPNNVELIRAVVHLINLNLREGRVDDAVSVADRALAKLPDPSGQSKEYAGELSELWFMKAAAHNRLRQLDKARAAFQKAIEVSPSPDSQNAQRAREWLEKIAARR